MSERYRLMYDLAVDGETADVNIYSTISSEKWYRDDDRESCSDNFDKALKQAKQDGAKNLCIHINSPGGEVYGAVAMRSMVINSKFDNVSVLIEGLCASAATLFATIPDATVTIADGSEFMIHNPSLFTWGNAAQLEHDAEHLRKMEQQFHAMYAAKTGKTEEQIKSWMDAETWFTAKEAVDNGFCDKLLSSYKKAVACVSDNDMQLMKSIYTHVPEDIGTTIIDVSNGASNAGEPTENPTKEEDTKMELNENTTVEQLKDANPALLASIQQAAITAERDRLSDIDALTLPGYEEMAEKAKADGTSAADFQKQLVKAMKEKGSEFLNQRKDETAPAADVTGGAPEDKAPEQEIDDFAKEMAVYTKEYAENDSEGMF